MQRTLDKGTALVSKRVKLADKSEFRWLTINEYLSVELESNSDYEKTNVSRRAVRKAVRMVVGSNEPIPLEDYQLSRQALRSLQAPQILRQAAS